MNLECVKKQIGYFAILLFLFISSCNSGDNLKIGLLLPNDWDDRYKKDAKYCSDKIKSLGGEPVVNFAQNNDQLQIKQANEMIDAGVGVLIIMVVNKNTAGLIVRKAQSNGIKVIAYDRIIANSKPDYFVSFDNVRVGELMAEAAIKIKPTGSYYIMGGDKSDQNAIWVREGMLNVINGSVKNGSIKVLYDVYTEDWSGDNSYNELKRFLNLSLVVPDVVLAAYDGLSAGGIKALEENKVNSFPIITGQNAEAQACRNIAIGKQTMTVYKPLKLEAESAAEIAMKCVRNENIVTEKFVSNGKFEIPAILLAPISVNAQNLKSTVIADGFLKEDEVFGKIN